MCRPFCERTYGSGEGKAEVQGNRPRTPTRSRTRFLNGERKDELLRFTTTFCGKIDLVVDRDE